MEPALKGMDWNTKISATFGSKLKNLIHLDYHFILCQMQRIDEQVATAVGVVQDRKVEMGEMVAYGLEVDEMERSYCTEIRLLYQETLSLLIMLDDPRVIILATGIFANY